MKIVPYKLNSIKIYIKTCKLFTFISVSPQHFRKHTFVCLDDEDTFLIYNNRYTNKRNIVHYTVL